MLTPGWASVQQGKQIGMEPWIAVKTLKILCFQETVCHCVYVVNMNWEGKIKVVLIFYWWQVTFEIGHLGVMLQVGGLGSWVLCHWGRKEQGAML